MQEGERTPKHAEVNILDLLFPEAEEDRKPPEPLPPGPYRMYHDRAVEARRVREQGPEET